MWFSTIQVNTKNICTQKISIIQLVVGNLLYCRDLLGEKPDVE